MRYIFSYLYILFISLNINCDIITLPFKRNLSREINETNFYSHYAKNEIYTKIKIGNPSKEINVQIKMTQYSFCIKNDSNIYNYLNSLTYNSNGKEIDELCSDYDDALSSKETFIIGNENIKAENLNFLLTKKAKFKSEGVLGLKIHEKNEETNGHGLISQLKSVNKLLNNQTFFFSYNKDGSDNGELILGEYPHLIDKYKKDYPQYQFKDTSISIINNDITFGLIFRSVFWNEKEFEKESRGFIEVESGYIYATKYFEDISFDFFSPHFRKGKCHREEVNVLYLAYICDDYPDLDLHKFPEIKFYESNLNYNLTLTYEELFIKKNGKVFFLVVFDKFGYNAFWHFGNIFLKRNKMVFDIDRRTIGIYDKNVKEEKMNYNYNIIIGHISVILICILIIIHLSVFIFNKFFLRKRNKKPYEIDEDFDYDAPINV